MARIKKGDEPGANLSKDGLDPGSQIVKRSRGVFDQPSDHSDVNVEDPLLSNVGGDFEFEEPGFLKKMGNFGGMITDDDIEDLINSVDVPNPFEPLIFKAAKDPDNEMVEEGELFMSRPRRIFVEDEAQDGSPKTRVDEASVLGLISTLGRKLQKIKSQRRGDKYQTTAVNKAIAKTLNQISKKVPSLSMDITGESEKKEPEFYDELVTIMASLFYDGEDKARMLESLKPQFEKEVAPRLQEGDDSNKRLIQVEILSGRKIRSTGDILGVLKDTIKKTGIPDFLVETLMAKVMTG